MWEAYEEEAKDILAKAQRALQEQSDETTTLLQQLNETLEQLALEAAAAHTKDERSSRTAQLRRHKAARDQLAAQLKRDHLGLPRDESLGGRADPEAAYEASTQRTRLLEATERLGRGADKLREAELTLVETEAIGAGIMSDLHSQRQTLMHSMGTMRGASEGLERSKRVLNAMTRRAFANRMLMRCMAATLACLLLFFAYLSLFGLGKGDAGEQQPTSPRI